MKKANYCDEFPSLTELRHVIPMTFRMGSLHTDSSSLPTHSRSPETTALTRAEKWQH